MSDEFFVACETGDLGIAKKLLRRDPSLLNKKRAIDDYSPLLLASFFNHQALVRFLLKKGAAVDLAKSDGATPLFMT